MYKTFEILGYNDILEQLAEYANSLQAKEKLKKLKPFLAEAELRKNMRDTTQARQMLEEVGTPPLPSMERVEEFLERAVRGDLLLPEEIEQIGFFFVAIKRLKSYLDRGKEKQIGIAFYGENLRLQEELYLEIERSIRAGQIDDYASTTLQDLRRKLQQLEEKIKNKAETILKSNKAYVTEGFVVHRNGRVCIPVKKEYKAKIAGSVVDKSATGTTLFLEPAAVARLREEYEQYKMEEDNEERRILYALANQIAEQETELRENISMVIKLDFIFAKGKLSAEMEASEPNINTERYIKLKCARHPMLSKQECVPLDFAMGGEHRGVVITGPNTGGKTVAIKTVGLLSLMAASGLHVPCQAADICMNSCVLCDIGDGQNLKDNLSTFSAHIRNILEILKRVNEESLVILDELGSGTDPTEGMGIAISILEQLRLSQCLFLITTHYPEVKGYAERFSEVRNARMAFDKESLKPLYKLEIGKAGESCALYIAKRLGFPAKMLRLAAKEAYGEKGMALLEELFLEQDEKEVLEKQLLPKIQKQTLVPSEAIHGEGFSRGDSVMVYPDEKIGIVVKPADAHGNILVQIQKEKILLNHKRLKLKVAAAALYPEDYDFSILFDTVENRKARHKMGKKHQENLMIYTEE